MKRIEGNGMAVLHADKMFISISNEHHLFSLFCFFLNI